MNPIIKEDIDFIIANFHHWGRFRNKTVLISGANGFLPAYLVETFLSLHHTNVIALVRNKEKAQKRFAHLLDNPKLLLFVQDVSEPFEFDYHVDFIIHAASQASPKYFGVDPVGTLNANVSGTLNLIKIAVKYKVESFLYFSSGEVYGEASAVPTKENDFGYLDCTKVRACYGESKRMGENICVSYFSQYGVKVKIVRPFHTYGPGMELNDGRVFADFVSNIVNGKDIVLMSDGSAIRAFCYLRDATLGFLTVLVNGVDGEAYNVGNPNEEHSILELATVLVNMYGLKVVMNNPAENTNYLKSPIARNSPSINKIKLLGWEPEATIEDGFKRTVDSFMPSPIYRP